MVEDVTVVDRLRLELAQAEDVLADTAAALESLPRRLRRRLTRAGVSPARLRRASRDAAQVLVATGQPRAPLTEVEG